MMKAIFLLIALVGAAAASSAPPAVDVYILAGQSNMSGRGMLADLTAAERIADPRIRLYGNDGRWHDAVDPLDDATGQVDMVSADAKAAVGPGLSFARAMLGLRKRPVVLVPCAKGGSFIGQWTPGGDRTTLYGSCLARVREAGGRVAGMLWYQGESDGSRAPAEAADWAPSFERLLAAFRTDLGVARLPVVAVGIADRPRTTAARYPGWSTIQEQQAHLASPCVAVVSAAGLPLNADELHLTTAAQRALGPRLAKAMTHLMRKGCRPGR